MGKLQTYRYGFNGKEKNQSGEFGLNHYDYGFRIYNPAIAKFLSVDPLTKSYPMLTPYQFASNTPIAAIDLDGLEGKRYHEIQKIDGKEQVIKVIYELDVYLISSSGNANSSSYSSVDISDVESDLNYVFNKSESASKLKDSKTGADIEFKFNVSLLEYSTSSVKLDRDGNIKFNRNDNYTIKTKMLSPSNGDIARSMMQRSDKVDEGTTKPAFVFLQTVQSIDGRGETTSIVKVAEDSSAGRAKTLGHEIAHFMLGLFKGTSKGASTNNLHHNLGGLLHETKPGNLNQKIIDKMSEFVPRSTSDDVKINK